MEPSELLDAESPDAPEWRPACHGLVPASSDVACPTCAAAQAGPPSAGVPAYVYAIGKIQARFPMLSVEKEFAQAIGRTDTTGQTDQEAFHTALSQPENRYLLRQLCWVFTIQGLDTYLLQPRESSDYDRLVEAIRPQPSPMDIDAVIGLRGPVAPPAMCNGLSVPIVSFSQIYSFDRAALISAIPRPERADPDTFPAVSEEVFDRIMHLADNAGATPEHRALNYLAMRYPGIYATAAVQFAANCSLRAVDVRPSRLSGARDLLDIIFSYSNRATDFVEKFYTRVDVTEEFPFLVTKMSPYYDR